MSQYILKYDKKGNLYNYIERNKSGKVLSFFYFKKNKLIRYDEQNNSKTLSFFNEEYNLVHKFSEGQSWITLMPKNGHVDLPLSKTREISIKNKNIIKFCIDRKFLKELRKKVPINSNEAKYPHIKFSPNLRTSFL